MEKIIEYYYENNAERLHKMVNKITARYGGITDISDFYSLANEVFVSSIKNFQRDKCDFECFLFVNLKRRIMSEIRDRNRSKRSKTEKVIDKNGNVTYKFLPDISIEVPLGDENGTTIADTLVSSSNVESEVFDGEGEEGLSDEMKSYLEKLSDLQKRVLIMMSNGYSPAEIVKKLHITQKNYADCKDAIKAYRNSSILFCFLRKEKKNEN